MAKQDLLEFKGKVIDLLPNANIIPKGKQKIRQKKETINVRDNPPHAPVSTHWRPNDPPEIK